MVEGQTSRRVHSFIEQHTDVQGPYVCDFVSSVQGRGFGSLHYAKSTERVPEGSRLYNTQNKNVFCDSSADVLNRFDRTFKNYGAW
jgi:hypothetical protein